MNIFIKRNIIILKIEEYEFKSDEKSIFLNCKIKEIVSIKLLFSNNLKKKLMKK